jgi:hypothetical protein
MSNISTPVQNTHSAHASVLSFNIHLGSNNSLNSAIQIGGYSLSLPLMRVLFYELASNVKIYPLSNNFFYSFFQKERLEREMEIKRVREELLAQAKE